MNDGLAKLRRGLDGCAVQAFDTAERAAACTVALAPDRFLKLSGTAATLAIGARAGDDLARLAGRCGSSEAMTAAACAALADKLDIARAKPQRPVAASFTAHRPWLSAARANAIGCVLAPLFAPLVMVAVGALVVGVTIVALATPRPDVSVGTFWAAYALTLGLLVIHELGHAGACVHHGARVGAVGLAIYLIYPALYCDVSDAWRLSRARRVAIDLGGIYLQMIATAAVAIAWRLTGAPVIYMVAVMSCGVAAMNLIPFFSLDGYWVLADAFGVANLRDKRRAVFATAWAKLRGRANVQFPWPTATTALVIAYSIGAVIFTVYVAYRLLPHAVTQLAAVPKNLTTVWTSAVSADGAAVLAATGRLATAALVMVFAFALIRRMLRTMVTLAKRPGRTW